MEMGPSGVLKHCDGKGGRLFIVLLPSDPLLFDWLCPQDERNRTLRAVFLCSDEAPFKSRLICYNQPAIGSTDPAIPANQSWTPENPMLAHGPLPLSSFPLLCPPTHKFLCPLPPPLLPPLPYAQGCKGLGWGEKALDNYLLPDWIAFPGYGLSSQRKKQESVSGKGAV